VSDVLILYEVELTLDKLLEYSSTNFTPRLSKLRKQGAPGSQKSLKNVRRKGEAKR